MMKLLCIVVIIAVGWLAVNGDGESRIIGGQDAVNGQFPHQVQIRPNNTELLHAETGGSIIGDRFVLALSSLYTNNVDPRDFKVIAGNVDIRVDAIQHQVDKFILHPHSSVAGNDVVVVRVVEPFIFSANVRAIQLPTEDLPLETEGFELPVVLTGWRWTHIGDDPIGPTLQWFNSTVMSKAECKEAWGLSWRNVHMCTKHKPDTGLCLPVALGGLITQDAEPVLLGVFYLRRKGCPSHWPNMYIRVFPHLEFIRFAMSMP